ncbi:hypothetical protein [Anaerotignum sp.]|uniref:hypothetical protein n=1 Tax=Anaerotignum sp. TaxID=2039241 RepID=UPI00332E17CB
MYHNPNLPDPFYACLCGCTVGHRPMPRSTYSNRPASSSNHFESPLCKEQQACHEPAICKEKPICKEPPICKEKSIQAKPSACHPQKGQIERELCKEYKKVNPCHEEKPYTYSGNGDSQFPFILLLLYFLRIF